MPSIKEIEDFVKKGLDNGKPEETIKSDLLSVGWKETDIEDTITAIKQSTPESRSENLAQSEANTPVNQLRFAHLKETISQYQPQKVTPIIQKISPKSRGIFSLILIPIVIALGVGARMYLKKTYPEMFEGTNNALDIDQQILNQIGASATSSPTSTPVNNSSPIAGNKTPTPAQQPNPFPAPPNPQKPPSAPIPSISVELKSPLKNAIWEIGKTYPIEWQANGASFWPIEIGIKQFEANSDTYYAYTLILTDGENTGKHSFTVPEKLLKPDGTDRMNFASPSKGASKYKIELRAWKDATEKVTQESDYFYIKPPGSTPGGSGGNN